MEISEIIWPEKLFVTGIDTDAGKSYATGWIARKIMESYEEKKTCDSKESVITQKFVQTGNREFSEDIKVHRDIMNCGMLTEDILHITAPLIYSYPASPDLAARIDGTEVDLTKITEATKELSSRYHHVLIEGAGGLMVPLKDEYLTIDYIKEHRLPTVLVTNGQLGSINHTLLSLYAIKQYGIELHSLIYNTYFDNDIIICEDTRKYLKNWITTHFPNAEYIEM